MSVDSAVTRPQHIARGIILIVATVFVISVQDVVFKFFSNELPLGQIFALRALLALPMLFILARWRGVRGSILIAALQKWPLVRSISLTLLFVAFYAGIPFVSLSALGAATYLAPIIVTVLSAYTIGEPVGFRGWIAVVLGFAGVLFLLQPGTDAFSPWVLLPVIGAIFYALGHIVTRSRCQSVSTTVLAFSLSISMMVAGLLISGIVLIWQPDVAAVHANPYLLGGWVSLDLQDWLTLSGLAVVTVVIGMGTAGAYKAAPPSIVATFEYFYLVFAALWDLMFFAAPPNGLTLFGMATIVLAGLLVLRRSG